MELCKDCGYKNVGAIYCAKCGSALYSRKRSEKSDDSMVTLSRLLTVFTKRS